MPTECYPIAVLPHLNRLFLDYAESHHALTPFFSQSPYSSQWTGSQPSLTPERRAQLAALLEEQNRSFGAGAPTLASIERLRKGAGAVVTGQQVGLLGGPLYTLLKAATAIRRAEQATQSGHPTVPIFWMATEDHDFAEVDHVILPGRDALHRLTLNAPHAPQVPVGSILLGEGIESVLAEAEPLLGGSPIAHAGASDFTERLRACYRPDATFAGAFGRMLAHVFARWGLIVIDAAARPFHALGRDTLRRALLEADEWRQALLQRGEQLRERGYPPQVLVAEGGSLLFLLDDATGARLPLRRVEGKWKAGKKTYTTEMLLDILEAAPERLSPNALLRPVFQDAILPTRAYIGGPAEIAYFAQSEVLYRGLLGRVTPILPRLSATLVEPAIASAMARYRLTLEDVYASLDALRQRLAGDALPEEGKEKLARAGAALEMELASLTAWMASLDQGLGRAAATAASKMRYQMNRLRRLAAHYQVQRESSLARHAAALRQALYPDGHVQERVIGGAYFLARYGEGLAERLIDAAGDPCPGHRLLFL